VSTENRAKSKKWWHSGHLHKNADGSKKVDFGDGWAEYFDAYASSYESNAFSEPGLEAMSKREVAAMVAGVKSAVGTKVLEVGSGEGRLTRALLREGYSIQTTDGAPGMVRVLTERYPQTSPVHMLLDGATIPFENGTFDAVAGLRVWKYVNTRNAVLREMRRVMKTDGVLVLEWTSKSGVAKFGYAGASINLLDRATVETELRAAGFDVVCHTTTTRLPQPLWKMSSKKGYVLFLNTIESIVEKTLRRVANGTLLSRSVVTVAKAA
jgi:ubiquinone/menaquinone biosynthesis C-methylase UbiE